MRCHTRARRARFGELAVAGVAVALAGPVAAQASRITYAVGPITEVSASCSGQNAEVEQAADARLGYVYETWMGCKGIAFARSANGGRSFGRPVSVPGSVGSNVNAWDPAVAVAPDGTIYASFMIAKGAQWYPVVAASFNHGASFGQMSSLVPPDRKNWGDRDFIAAGPSGTVYVSSRAITRRTVRSLMLAFRAIVAADGQQPVPSSREHASASARRTRRSLPEVGEFAHTQFITAMLTEPASQVSDSGSGKGAAGPVRRGQARSPEPTGPH